MKKGDPLLGVTLFHIMLNENSFLSLLLHNVCKVLDVPYLLLLVVTVQQRSHVSPSAFSTTIDACSSLMLVLVPRAKIQLLQNQKQ